MLGNESSNIKGIGDQNIFIGHYILQSLYFYNNFHPVIETSRLGRLGVSCISVAEI